MINMKRAILSIMVALLVFLCFASAAFAQEQMTTYSGDLWTRSTLTGDWGGIRNDLAKKGVTFDLNLTQIVQGDVSGGKKIGWEYGGRGDLTLNVDTQKLGWWPGGFFTVEAEGNFGNSVNSYTGALMPVNTNQIFPMPNSDQLNIPAVTFMQFFSRYVGVAIGKVATITSTSGDMNEFAHGKGDTQFLNMAFNFNPVITLTVPYSTLAAGVIILPTKDPKEAVIGVNVLDTSGTANSSGFDTVFKGNTTYAIEGRVRTDFLGMTGHQLVGATYSAKNYSSLDQSLRFFIESRAIAQQDNSWCFYYNFDQYLYEPKKGSGRGIGIFGRFGASDGNPNPFHYFYSIGVGGKGVLPGRPNDQFGIGYYYIDVSQPRFTGPLQTRTALGDEQGFEAYYNFAITPWMKFTPDIQVIRGAQKQEITTGFRQVGPVQIPTISSKNIDTAALLGFRLQIVF
jgi:porin